MRQMVSVNPPSGFRDFINRDARRRLQLIQMISDVYQSFGFSPLETPVVENLDLLVGGGGGEENEKLIFKILKRGEKLTQAVSKVAEAMKGVQPKNPSNLEKELYDKQSLSPSELEAMIGEFGLRFDLTLPLTRVVALHRGQIHFPWKVFHIAPVWRAERAQKGRFREFIQCDVDIVGAKGIAAEIEVIQAVVHAVSRAGAPSFDLHFNDRRLIEAMATHFGFGDGKIDKFAVILDKKDKLSREAWLAQLEELAGQKLSTEFLSWMGESGENEALDPLSSVETFHPQAVQDLRTLKTTLETLQLPLSKIVFDPSLVRGMGYYTGPVFELRHSSAGYSFGGGGRYDRLIGRLSGQAIPACGFSIGFERLALLLAEQEQAKAQDTAGVQYDSKTVFIPVFEESLRPSLLKLANTLRIEGRVVDVYPDQAKVKNQMKFASDSHYRWVLIVGGQEWETQIFKVKDFKTGTEESVTAQAISTYLQERTL